MLLIAPDTLAKMLFCLFPTVAVVTVVICSILKLRKHSSAPASVSFANANRAVVSEPTGSFSAVSRDLGSPELKQLNTRISHCEDRIYSLQKDLDAIQEKQGYILEKIGLLETSIMEIHDYLKGTNPYLKEAASLHSYLSSLKTDSEKLDLKEAKPFFEARADIENYLQDLLPVFGTPIESVGFPARVINALRRDSHGYRYLEELANPVVLKMELFKIRNLGAASIDCIHRALIEHGYNPSPSSNGDIVWQPFVARILADDFMDGHADKLYEDLDPREKDMITLRRRPDVTDTQDLLSIAANWGVSFTDASWIELSAYRKFFRNAKELLSLRSAGNADPMSDEQKD